MSEFKGTPGTWVAADTVIIESDGSCIAEINVDDTSWEQDEYNATLMAAAPELLEALQEMTALVKKHSYPQPDKPSSNYARAEYAESVIAKALGK